MFFSRVNRTFLASAASLAAFAPAFSQSLPSSTAIPVVLTRTVDAGRARPGDPVVAKTLQAIVLPGSRVLPAGTRLTGHIVSSAAFHFDATPYAVQTPSALSIHFDAIDERGSATPVTLSLRALAGPVASHDAEVPQGLDETDWSSTRTLVGGDTTSPLDQTVLAADGSIVGYNRAQGIYARLLAAVSAKEPAIACEAGSSEQSVALFSPDACGVYGLNSIALAGNGAGGDGTFILESRQRNVELNAGTTALLEVVAR